MVTVGKSVIHGSDSWGYGKGMYLNTWGDARNTEDVTARSFIIFRGDTFKGNTGFVVSSLGGYYQKKTHDIKIHHDLKDDWNIGTKKLDIPTPFTTFIPSCFSTLQKRQEPIFRATPKKKSARAWEESSPARYRFS